MQAALLTELLSRLGLPRDGDSFSCPPGHLLTVYLGAGTEPLIIDKVTRVDVTGEFTLITSARRERFATLAAQVLAVRLAADAK
jgi:hypothetical protein